MCPMRLLDFVPFRYCECNASRQSRFYRMNHLLLFLYLVTVPHLPSFYQQCYVCLAQLLSLW